MSFATVVDAYCNALGVTNAKIAQTCGLSPSALSRYRSGERKPELGSEQMDCLVKGLSALSREREDENYWQESSIRDALEGSLSGSNLLGMSFGARVDALMTLLGLRNAEIARAIGVSSSYVSRIRSDQRRPQDLRRFTHFLSVFAAQRSTERGKTAELISLVEAAGDIFNKSHLSLDSHADLAEIVEQWLLGSNIVESDLVAVENLFAKLNDFYFTKVLDRIAEIVPIESGSEEPRSFTRFYYNLDGMRKAELDFLEISAACDASNVFLSSDMPLLEMTINSDFLGRYLFGLGSLIRKGSKITIVHGVERPLAEAVKAFELSLPLYLTGQVTPYFLKGVSNRLFCHVNYVSDACALSAEAVIGHQSSGRYYLSTEKEDVSYYQQKMNHILEHTSTLIEIYHHGEFESHEDAVAAALKDDNQAIGYAVGVNRYENLRISSFPGRCAVVTILYEPVIHLVIRHPKIRYVISHIH